MADVYYDAFISYSTQDTEFVTKIRLMLELSGRRVWQDIKDIELTAQWWAQIKAGIAASDNFLFVVSPRAMASPICHLELEHARQLNKRVIIIRYEEADPDISTKAMVERILTQHYLKTVTSGRDMFGVSEENWRTIEAEQNISITNESEMLSKVPKLIEAFDKDLLYIRQGNILLGRATEWQESGQNPSFLLVGEALKAAEAWRDVGKHPAPTADHLAYITASRQEENRRRRELRNLRIGRLSFAAVGMLAAIVALASLVSLNDTQRRAAIASTQVAFSEATVTQAAIRQHITSDFSKVLLNQSDSLSQRIATMDALVLRYPTETRAYQLRGIFYVEQNDFVKAIKDFDEAIRLDPKDAAAYYNRGLAYYSSSDFESAIKDFDEAIRLDPKDAAAYYNRGLAYYSSSDLESAIKDFDEAIRLDPNFVAAYYNRGGAHHYSNNFEDAIADYTNAINLTPNFAVAYNSRAVARYNSGDVKGAIKDYGESIRIDPNNALTYLNRGLARHTFGDTEGAIADFSQGIRLDSNLVGAYSSRGIAYFLRAQEQTDPEERVADLKQALADWRQAETLGVTLSDVELNSIAQIESELGGTPTPVP